MKRSPARITGVLAVTTMLLAAAACGGGGDAETAGESIDLYGTTVSVDPDLADRVPEDLKAAGKIVAPLRLQVPMADITPSGEPSGVVVDLVKGIGTKLGLEVEFQEASFDALFPGVLAETYTLTTATGDFAERRETLEFVDFLKSGWNYVVAKGNPEDVDDLMSQCGLRVGVGKGTTQELEAQQLSQECVTAGKPALDLQSFSNTQLTVPLSADRVDVIWENTSAAASYTAEPDAQFEIAGEPDYSAYYAFGVIKGDVELRDLLQDALQSMIDDGSYTAILEEWDLEDLAVEKATVNSDIAE